MTASLPAKFRLISAVLGTLVALSLSAAHAQYSEPDLRRLRESGYIMGPGNDSYPVSDGWKVPTSFMKAVSSLDDVAARIEQVVCGSQTNKSVLLIGEPSQAYVYLFARLAAGRAGSKCPADMWHVEINVNKIEAGHQYVGQVERYWDEEVLGPADKKNVILYFRSLDGLIGVGSHSNDQDGIEKEYASNLSSGRIRTIAFVDKYVYNELIRSRAAYVAESFADRIVLPSFTPEQTMELARAYMVAANPRLHLEDKLLKFIIDKIAFYQPSRQEPDRTMSVLNKLIRLAAEKEAASGQQTIAFTAETEHPYKNNARQEWEISAPEGYSALAFVFDKFETERDTDILTITDADSGVVLGNLSGRLQNGYTSQIYGAKHIKLTFTSDSRYAMNGFNLVRAIAYKQMEYTFSREDARRAVMEVAQVPRWLIDRDFRVIADLKGKLDADVVGVAEGKRDLVRLAKNGYISGRTDEKPIATAMLAGPTGTGKSYIAKRMADFLEMKLITFDMTSYKDASTFPVFQESLARALTNNPYAVYLFEEIDKASIEVLDQLYFMTDEGVFYDRSQRPIFARGAFILMTTNAASDVILHDPNNPNLRDIVMADLKKHFRPSFLNRFDAISIFKPFTDAEYLQLATTLVRKKIKNVREQLAWGLSVDEGTIQFISINGRSPEFGARPMERMVESTIGIGIAEYQLKFGALLDDAVIQIAKLQGNRDFRITVAGGQALDYRVDDTNGMGFEPFFFKRAGRRQTPLRATNEFALDLHKFFNRVRLYTPHD